MKTILIVLGVFLLSFDMFCQSKIENDILCELNKARIDIGKVGVVEIKTKFKQRTSNHNKSLCFSIENNTINDSIHFEFIENDTIEKHYTIEERYDNNGNGEVIFISKNIKNIDTKTIITGFLNSPLHRKVILSDKHNSVSISVNEYISNDNKKIVITTMFLYNDSKKALQERSDRIELEKFINDNNIKTRIIYVK